MQFNISKLQILETEKSRIRTEFERREAAVEVKKKVEYSKQLNESRIKVLQAREAALQTLLEEADARLAGLSKDATAYEKLLVKLTVQAYGKIAEPSVLVRFREVDAKLADKVIAAAADEFKKAYGKEAPKAGLDEAHPLPPPPTKDTTGEGFSTWYARRKNGEKGEGEKGRRECRRGGKGRKGKAVDKRIGRCARRGHASYNVENRTENVSGCDVSVKRPSSGLPAEADRRRCLFGPSWACVARV